MKMMPLNIVFSLALASLACADFETLSFTRIGFPTPDGLVLVSVENGAVTWPKGPPKTAKAREFWDQVALSKAAKPEIGYTTSHAVADWNSLVAACQKHTAPEGDATGNAEKLWKAIKTLFPKAVKQENEP